MTLEQFTEPYELWREDDNGVRVLMRKFASRAEAEAEQARFRENHKQTYWVEARPPNRLS